MSGFAASSPLAERHAEPAPGRFPWLGAASFAELRDARPERLVAETREEKFWRRACPWIFAPRGRPGALARFVHHITVAPMAFVTFLNLHYQLYLGHLLHTTPQAWLSHVVCIPANVALLFYGLAVFAPFSSSSLPSANLGLLLAPLLCLWYVGMAAKLRNPLWGVTSCALLAGLFLAGNALAAVTVDPSSPSAWSRTPWYVHPVFLIGVVSTLQAAGHMFEYAVPPRANRSDRWTTTREFLWGSGTQVPLWKRLAYLSWTPFGLLWGAIDEWWSSAKLLPLFLLQLMWALGYKPEQRREFLAETFEVLRRGNPAMDWVGSGGGAFVSDLDPPAGEARRGS